MILLAQLLLTLVAQDFIQHPLPGQVCQVEVRAVDPFGGPVKDAAFRVDGDNETHAIGKAVTLPCGKRRIAVWATGFRTKSREMMITDQYQFALVSLEIGSIEGAPRPMPRKVVIPSYEAFSHRCPVIKMVPLLSPEKAYDSKVSQKGIFMIPGDTVGPHAFVLLGERGVCSLAYKDIESFSSQQIDIPLQATGPI